MSGNQSNNREHTTEHLSRREFGRHVSLAGLLAAVTASETVCAENSPKKQEDPEQPAPLPAGAQKDGEKAAGPPSIEEALMAIIVQRYPHPKLTAAIQEEIYGDLLSDLGRSQGLTNYPLKNHQEPAFIFRAYRQDQS